MSEKGKIRKFLVEKRHFTPLEAERLANKIMKYDDILQEFLGVVETKKIPEDGVNVGNWTAKTLSEKLQHLELENVYEFLVGLRDEPEKFEKYIAEGAPTL